MLIIIHKIYSDAAVEKRAKITIKLKYISICNIDR